MAEEWQQWALSADRLAQEPKLRSSAEVATNATKRPLSRQQAEFPAAPHIWNEAMDRSLSPIKKENSDLRDSVGQATNENYQPTDNDLKRVPIETKSDLSSQSQDVYTEGKPLEHRSPQNGTAKHPRNIRDQPLEGQDEEEETVGLWRSRWAVKVSVQTLENDTYSSNGCSVAIDKVSGVSKDKKNTSNKKENIASKNEEKQSIGTTCRVKEADHQPLTNNVLTRAIGVCPKIRPESIDRLSKVSNTGVTEINFAKPSDHLDINGQPESDFRAKEPHQIWTGQNWDETRRPRMKKYADDTASKDSDEVIVTSYLQEYVDNWRQTAHQIETHFLTSEVKNSEDCDVDTVTGNLMPPVEFPFTKSNYDEAGRITSEMRIQSCILKSSVRKAKKKLKKETRTAAKVDAVEREPSPELPLDPNQVLTPSHLRPATESDLEGIADIYNNEVKHSYKVMDVEPVSLEKFRQLYLACRNEKMPFVVAFEGWYNSHKTPNPKLIGFALVDAVARGLTGSYATHSRHGGKITVIVHPDFRRKKIGTALLDIILSSCSQRYFTRQGYQFENPTQDMTLMRPMYNSRTWRYLEMEVIIRTGESEEETRKGDEFQWIWNFLEARFLLILVHYDEKVLRDPRTNPKQGLDRLTFRHICRNLKED